MTEANDQRTGYLLDNARVTAQETPQAFAFLDEYIEKINEVNDDDPQALAKLVVIYREAFVRLAVALGKAELTAALSVDKPTVTGDEVSYNGPQTKWNQPILDDTLNPSVGWPDLTKIRSIGG